MKITLKESMTVNYETDFDKYYKGSYYTIEGAGGDLSEWVEGINGLFKELNIGQVNPEDFVTFSGSDMNDYYNLTGTNRYPNDLTFLAFPLDGLNVGKLAMFKLRRGDRWFDDIVDNNARREGRDED